MQRSPDRTSVDGLPKPIQHKHWMFEDGIHYFPTFNRAQANKACRRGNLKHREIEGARSYFVGGDPNFPKDKSFALAPWVKARYDNLGEGDVAIQIHGDIAITMG